MNKGLEYINYKIATAEDSLQHYTMVEPDKYIAAWIKHDLECLYKIKADLEAWEVVKQHCDYQDGDRFNCIPEGFYLIEPIKGKDFLIVRKALEEKHE